MSTAARVVLQQQAQRRTRVLLGGFGTLAVTYAAVASYTLGLGASAEDSAEIKEVRFPDVALSVKVPVDLTRGRGVSCQAKMKIEADRARRLTGQAPMGAGSENPLFKA